MGKNISTFLDENGKVKRWPKKKQDKINVLNYLKEKFVAGKKYSEKEINIIIKEWHCFNDHALLRRELFNNYILNRTNDCKEYWLQEVNDIN